MSSWKNAEKNRKRTEREARFEKEREVELAAERQQREEKVDRYMPLLDAIAELVQCEVGYKSEPTVYGRQLQQARKELLETMVEVLP